MPSGFISLEIRADQFAERPLSIRTHIPGKKIKRGTFIRGRNKKIEEQDKILRKAPLFIHDTAV